MKYVMFECRKRPDTTPVRVPILFPNALVHADAATYVKHWLRREHNLCEATPISAGEYYPVSRTVGGYSESLKLKSDPKDAETITNCDQIPWAALND